jgi:hypothetical protein
MDELGVKVAELLELRICFCVLGTSQSAAASAFSVKTEISLAITL